MKVKITHTLELDKVPVKVNELIQPSKRDLQRAISHLQSIDFLLSVGCSEESVSLARAHIDALRKSLTSVDEVLVEAHSMISGVDDYNMQVLAKEAMERELEAQEQADVSTAQITPEDEVEPEPPRKRWNPHTIMLEDIDQEAEDDKSF